MNVYAFTLAEIDAATVPTLRKLAAQAEIPGRSTMRRPELVAALVAFVADQEPRPAMEHKVRTVPQKPFPIFTHVRVTSLHAFPDRTRPAVTGMLAYVGPEGEHWVEVDSEPQQQGPYLRSELVAEPLQPWESLAPLSDRIAESMVPMSAQPEQQQGQATVTPETLRMRLIGRRAHKPLRRADRKAQKHARRANRV